MYLQKLFLSHFWKYLGKHASSVVIYGAGKHTEELVYLVKDKSVPEIIAIVDDDPC